MNEARNKGKSAVALIIEKNGDVAYLIKGRDGFWIPRARVGDVYLHGDLAIRQEIEDMPFGNSQICAVVGNIPIRVMMIPDSMLFLEMHSSNWDEMANWLSKKKIELKVVSSRNDPVAGGQAGFILNNKYACNVHLNDFWIDFLGKHAVNPEMLNEAR